MTPHGQAGKPKRASRAFSQAEYDQRWVRLRRAMNERGLDAILVSSPENIYYLTGLDYQGYFAYQLLIVPLEGAPILITRAMEAPTIRDKVPHVHHVGYSDGIEPIPPARAPDADLVLAESRAEEAAAGLRPWSASLGVTIRGAEGESPPAAASAAVTCNALIEAGLKRARLGIEKSGSFLPLGIAEAIMHGLSEARFEDASDLVSDCRLVQSPRELAYTRKAAAVSESMMLAGIAAAGPGVHKRDVMAAIYQTMFSRGGTYPGFVPLVRSTHTLEHEHGPWEDDRLARRDVLFLELSGCVRRYHAPISRLVFIGKAPARAERIRRTCEAAIEAAEKAIRPGARASEVYAAWQRQVDEAGLAGYRRHHCGYSVGIGFPPSWTGSGVPLGLRDGSSMQLRAGMVFHLMSWLLRTGRGDFVISDAVAVTETGCEVLTNVSRGLIVR